MANINQGKRKRRQQQARKPAPLAKKRNRGDPVAANDVYEAEDSDPDEVKHANRYDKVDNYEYELPSDFEDEEIDEELAFTAEDKKKYAGWFDDEAPSGDGADADLLDSDDGMYEDEDEEGPGFDDERDDDGAPVSEELADGDYGDDDLDGSDSLGEGEGDEDELQDDERYRDMLAAVVGDKPRKRARIADQHVVNEAYPESEFNLNPTAASTGTDGLLTVEELMHGLGKDKRKLGAARKVLEKLSSKQAVAAPLPRLIKERQERKAGYETTTEDVSKWQPIIKANREAPTLSLLPARDEVPRTMTTAAIVAKHEPANDLEEEVAALLEAAGAANAKAVQEAEDQLSLKHLTLEEARERRERLAKMRSLLFYHELKAKRLKAIKSKDYHRKLAKAAKRKAQNLTEVGEDEALKEAALAAEFDRAKERLTLKHKNTSRWARRALKRGINVMDAGTKAAIAEQLQLGDALKRRIEGGDDGSDSEGSTSASDDDNMEAQEGAVPKPLGRSGHNRARAAALDILAGAETGAEDQQVPQKGLFALPFMARALERQRQAARQEAQALLQELEQQEEQGADDGAALAFGAPSDITGAAGRLRFGGPAGSAADADADSGMLPSGSDAEASDEEEDAEAKAKRLGKRLAGAAGQQAFASPPAAAAARRSKQPTAEEEADLDRALVAGPGGGATAMAEMQELQAARRASSAGASTSSAAAAAAGAAQACSSRMAASQAGGAAGACATGSGAGAVGSNQTKQAGAAGAIAAAAAGQAAFQASKKFQGPRPGYVFNKGPLGVGYYLDNSAAPVAYGHAASTTLTARISGQAVAAASAVSAAATNSSVGAVKKVTPCKQQRHQQQRKGLGDGVLEDLDMAAAPANGAAVSQGAAAANAAAAAAAAADSDDEQDGGAGREGMKLASTDKATLQRQLISMAFAGDDVEAEFVAEKAADVAGELPAAEAPSSLPGWGMWADQQLEPRWMREARAKAESDRAKAAAGRRDASLQHVMISEKWDKKAAKYQTPSVPFPFDSKETYERSMRQPLGREYNPDTAFRNLTRPAVLKNTGVIIEPIRYSKPMAKTAAKAGGAVSANGIAVVAGGMPKKGRKH